MMAKERSDKKEKKEKKEKRSEKDGVHKSKKDKKDKSTKSLENGEAAIAIIDSATAVTSLVDLSKSNGDVKAKLTLPIGALVPFANPLADEKVGKKVFKSVKKAAKNKCLKRGVKEVVKALRKSSVPGAKGGSAPGVVILAADISPMDVISHIPVLCEDHNVPYVFVTSRAELGMAGNTKRPTSVVMVSPERGGKKKAGEEPLEGEDEYKDVYKDLVKVVEKEGRTVKV